MTLGDKVRVLIVDDSAVIRMLLSQLIGREPDLQLVGAESNGRSALDRLAELRPDVVVLDVEMPGMSGVETVSAIRAKYPRLPMIMFSAYTEEGASVTIEALSRGAADYVTKPTQAVSAEAAIAMVREQLVTKIRSLGQVIRKPISALRPELTSDGGSAVHWKLPRPAVELICIVASTGGPEALTTTLSALPATFPVPIAVVQHMPPFFTRQLAQRLAEKCAIRVREAESGEALKPGTALIAPGDFHLLVRSRTAGGFVVTNRDEPENSCRPSADVLLRSAADAFGRRTMAIVLTGMGQDGLKGCEAVRGAGGRVVAQDEATSIVWGMPGAVTRAGLAAKVLPIEKVAAELIRHAQDGRT